MIMEQQRLREKLGIIMTVHGDLMVNKIIAGLRALSDTFHD